VFGAGLAAVAAVLDTVPLGGLVVAPRGAYTGTRRLLAHQEAIGRVRTRLVDIADTEATVAALDGAHLLWVESPTNPLLAVADLPALLTAARDRRIPAAVDSTFATPLLQRPLDLGADLVVHSATKLIAGHSDVLLGVVVTRDPARVEALKRFRTLAGGVAGPMEAWLGLRGLRTLPLRLERAQANAGELARRLSGHPAVARVRYPGLPDDPGHDRAARQMAGFGTMIAFDVAGGAEPAEAACAGVRLVVHATSLGGVDSSMERRARHPHEEGTPPGLIRLSVGCEHVEDLWDDLARALDGAVGVGR
jgi:cystathionine gamma-synthase